MVLSNKAELTSPINFWTPLLDRLNFICLAIRFTLFHNPIDPEKDKKMNALWRTFFENVKLINLQVKNHQLDPKKVSSSQEKNLKLHKKFFMFWFKELIPKMGSQTDLEDIREFLQKNFTRIYGEGDLRWMFQLSEQSKIPSKKNITNRKVSESVHVKSLKMPTRPTAHSFDFSAHLEKEKKRASLKNSKVNNKEEEPKENLSMLVSGSVLNRMNTPMKRDLKMVKEEQSVSTDSEMEQLQKTISDFKNRKPETQKSQVLGETLNLKRNETFDNTIRYSIKCL